MEKEIEGIRKTGRLVLDTLDLVESELKAGITAGDIDRLVHDFTVKNDAIPATLQYRGFPKSACVSINEVVCHGIPGDRTINNGDIVNVDITSILDGYYADASKTFLSASRAKMQKRLWKQAKMLLKKEKK